MIRYALASFLRSVADWLSPPTPSGLHFDAHEQTLVLHAAHHVVFTAGFQEQHIEAGDVLHIQIGEPPIEARSLH